MAKCSLQRSQGLFTGTYPETYVWRLQTHTQFSYLRLDQGFLRHFLCHGHPKSLVEPTDFSEKCIEIHKIKYIHIYSPYLCIKSILYIVLQRQPIMLKYIFKNIKNNRYIICVSLAIHWLSNTTMKARKIEIKFHFLSTLQCEGKRILISHS